MSGVNKEEFQKLSDLGFSMIRVKGKTPIHKSWQEACRVNKDYDPEVFGDHNAGIACGTASNTLVIDIDDIQKFANFVKANGYKLPLTRIHRTGSDKFHFLYKYPSDGEHYGNRSLKPLGFDIRGDGGQIVAPGSVHPETGRLYRVEKDVEMADAPAWLRDLALEKKANQNSSDPEGTFCPDFLWADDLPALQIDSAAKQLITIGVPKGERSEAQASIICKLLLHNPPLTDAQILGIFDRFPIGDKMREKGEDAARWLQDDITRMKAELAAKSPVRNARQPGGNDKTKESSILVVLAEKAMFFRTDDGDLYASIFRNDHEEHWSLTSKTFKDWLSHKYYTLFNKPPGSQAIQDALNVLRGKAQFEGEVHDVFLRVAAHDQRILIDLANKHWEVVEITGEGWSVVQNSPVRFARNKNMLSLPKPQSGGTLQDLRRFINVSNNDDWMLLVAFLVQALNPSPPYPILILEGEQGAAKTTAAKVIKLLIDPSKAPVRSHPKEERDLLIAAKNSWMLAFGNLSGLPAWLSDALCRLSTGGGFATRALYADAEETVISATRPVILNGIDRISNRNDLTDRAIIINQPPIADDARILEVDLWNDFEKVRAGIFGALCDAVSRALRNRSTTRLDNLPRMADFAVWVSAAESALPWECGEFLSAYSRNRAAAVELSVDADPVADSLRQFIDRERDWTGTARDLLEELNGIVLEDTRKSKFWPKSPDALSKRLKRASPCLRTMGIVYEDLPREGGTGARLKRVYRLGAQPDSPEGDPPPM
jgi:hypothetical protein